MTTALRLTAAEHHDASLTHLGRALDMPTSAILRAGHSYLRTGTIGVRILNDDLTVDPGQCLEVEIGIYSTALSDVIERTAHLERCTAAEIAATARALAGQPCTVRPVVATVPNNLGYVDICVRHEAWGAEVDVRPSYTSDRWLPLTMLGGAFVERER